jgi:imidazolonepropionase-like amidohydrolase
MPVTPCARLLLAAALAVSCARFTAAPKGGPAEIPPTRGPDVLLRGATVLTAAGPALEHADVWVADGRIAQVGTGVTAPASVRVVDVTGRWITPGIIDPHSHLGVYAVPNVSTNSDGNEMTGPFKPEVRAEDSFWPQDPAIERALAGGVTTIHVLPGSANLVGGQGVTLRLVPGLSARELRFPGAPATMKLACGENPMRVYGSKGQAPQTRMAEVAMLRQELENARAYKPEEGKARDFANEALADVLSGETLIENHCYRADEMLLRLDVFREFGIAPRAFHHAVEAYKIRDRLREAGVGAVVWADWWGIKLELLDAVPANAALLDEAGVTVALHSDSPDEIQRLNQEAAKARAAGLRAGIPVTPERALRWITANPAWVLGIESRVGTLERGKDADLVVWSGDPFSVYARAEQVFIAGERVWARGAASEPRSDFELGLRPAP